MSALQEILEKGYVDPELLAQLGEEQKQILFIKMREEQVRKWRMHEAQLEERERNGGGEAEDAKLMGQKQINGGRRVQWLTGKDGNIWVWVMGEHSNDLSIEQILARESKEQARRLAENEIIQTLRKADDLPNALEMEEAALKAELAQMELNDRRTLEAAANSNNGGLVEQKTNSHSPYDDLLAAAEGEITHQKPQTSTATNNNNDNTFIPNPTNHITNNDIITNSPSPAVFPTPLRLFSPTKFSSTNSNSLPFSAKSNKKVEMNAPQNGKATEEQRESRREPPQEIYDNLGPLFPVHYSSYGASSNNSSPNSSSRPFDKVIVRTSEPAENGGGADLVVRHIPIQRMAPNSANKVPITSSTIRPTKPPPVPEKPPFLRRTVSNAVNEAALLLNNDGCAEMLPNALPDLEQFAFNTIRSYIPDSEVERRQSKIFEQLQEQREKLALEAEEEAQRGQTQWEAQERRAREAEQSIREIAQKAREQHRKCVRTSDSLLPLVQIQQRNGERTHHPIGREALKGIQRPPKPKSRAAILHWFRQSELAQWQSWRPPLWFHGIISRQDTEQLMEGRSVGAFLVRVTERIFGYTVSYKAFDGMRNFLVERIPQGYQFMGTNQLVHPSLAELISHHQSVPITAKGGEVLREPVGQLSDPPDYDELFREVPPNSGNGQI